MEETMANAYTVSVELIVTDRAALAAYAQKRAVDCGITELEFKAYEAKAYEGESEIEFWLGWVFDNGSPPGIEIQDTAVSVIRVA
jgi:hypothetical protein